MLPDEEYNVDLVKKQFGNYIDAGYDVLKTGLEVIQAWKDQGNPETMASDAVDVLTRTIYHRYRSILALCEMGHLVDADVLARSLFESFLSARFVLIPQSPNPTWSPELRSEFEAITNLCGDDTTTQFSGMEFRASVYFACDPISLERLHNNRRMNHLAVDDQSARDVSMMIEKTVQKIGEPWVNHLRNLPNNRRGANLGFSSVKTLAEYCDLKEYYLTVYPLQSHKSHGKGAVSVLDGENADLIPTYVGLSGVRVGQFMDDLNKAFQLNLDEKISDFFEERFYYTTQ